MAEIIFKKQSAITSVSKLSLPASCLTHLVTTYSKAVCTKWRNTVKVLVKMSVLQPWYQIKFSDGTIQPSEKTIDTISDKISRYDMIRSASAVRYERTIGYLTNYSYMQTRHKMGQHAVRSARRISRPNARRGGRRDSTPPAPSSAIRQRRPSPASGGSHRPHNRDDDAIVRSVSARPSRYLEGRGQRRRPTRRHDVCSLSQPRP